MTLLVRTLKTALMGVLASLVLAPLAHAQSMTGTVNVVNLLPNTVVGHEDLDFGNVIAPTAAATLTVNAQTGAATPSGGLVLAGGSPNPGEFTGYGSAGRLVLVTGPTGLTLTRAGGGATMTVDQLRFSINNGAPVGTFLNLALLDSAGFIYIKTGGRLNIGAAQAAGSYSGTYNITVIYF